MIRLLLLSQLIDLGIWIWPWLIGRHDVVYLAFCPRHTLILNIAVTMDQTDKLVLQAVVVLRLDFAPFAVADCPVREKGLLHFGRGQRVLWRTPWRSRAIIEIGCGTWMNVCEECTVSIQILDVYLRMQGIFQVTLTIHILTSRVIVGVGHALRIRQISWLCEIGLLSLLSDLRIHVLLGISKKLLVDLSLVWVVQICLVVHYCRVLMPQGILFDVFVRHLVEHFCEFAILY